MKKGRIGTSMNAEPRAIREYSDGRKIVASRIWSMVAFVFLGVGVWFAILACAAAVSASEGTSDADLLKLVGAYLDSLRDSARQEDIGLATGAIAFTGLTIIIDQAMKVVEKGIISLPRHRDQPECDACETSTEGRMATRRYAILFFAQTLAAVVSIFALGCTYLAFVAETDVAGFAYLIMGLVLLFFLWDSTSLEFQFGVSAGESKREWDAQEVRQTIIRSLFQDGEETETGLVGERGFGYLEVRRNEISRGYRLSRIRTWVPLAEGTVLFALSWWLVSSSIFTVSESTLILVPLLIFNVLPALIALNVSPVRASSDWVLPATVFLLPLLSDVIIVVYTNSGSRSALEVWSVAIVLGVSLVFLGAYLDVVLRPSSPLRPEACELYLRSRKTRNLSGRDEVDDLRQEKATVSNHGLSKDTRATRVSLVRDDDTVRTESARVVCSYWDEATATWLYLTDSMGSLGNKCGSEWQALPMNDTDSAFDEFGIRLFSGEYEYIDRFVNPGTKVRFHLESGYSWVDSCWATGESSLESDGNQMFSCKETIALDGNRTQLRLKATTSSTGERLDRTQATSAEEKSSRATRLRRAFEGLMKGSNTRTHEMELASESS